MPSAPVNAVIGVLLIYVGSVFTWATDPTGRRIYGAQGDGAVTFALAAAALLVMVASDRWPKARYAAVFLVAMAGVVGVVDWIDLARDPALEVQAGPVIVVAGSVLVLGSMAAVEARIRSTHSVIRGKHR